MQDKDSGNEQLDWLSESANAKRLSSGFPEKMVILDCETTGGKATFHRITEIGLLVIEEGEITERWQQLINPRTHIPPEIQRLTGITPALLKDAPEFADIAKTLLTYLKDRVLVAHNARFDYGFLKNEFSRLNIAYSTSPLCSVKVSRRLFPQYKRHSLNAIIKRFNFSIENRHRGLDDALMVWKLFLKASALFPAEDIQAVCDQALKRPSLPMQLDPAEIDKLPKAPGVYYFYDSNDKLLYIGKSVSIRDRVMSHFTQDYRNAKDLQMSALIAHIDFERTPSDFGAQIRESQQIKALNPYYNRRLRKVTKLYQLITEPDAAGYLHIAIRPAEQTTSTEALESFGLFRSRRQAEGQLNKLVEHFFLCQKLCGLQSGGRGKKTPCFGFQLKRCFGACCSQEPADAYNERVLIALQDYRQRIWPWPDAVLLEERDKTDEYEATWHLLDQWRYLTTIRDQEELYAHGYQLASGESPGTANNTEPTGTDDKTGTDDFDLDVYLIMVRFMLNAELMQLNRLRILPLCRATSE
ncbi:MAG: exonuclease domain-containing protein [Thiolinea sp.]